MPVRKIDFETALRDPRAVFDTPEQVLADPRLDRQGKVSILRSWRDNVERPEGRKAAAPEDLLSRVDSALEALKEQPAGRDRHARRIKRRRRS
jgi:hypothetical protein